MSDFAENLIQILNHILSYGFQGSLHSSNNSEDATLSNSSAHEESGSFVSSSGRDHYWDLISKYFSSEYQSVSYINNDYSVS